MITRYYMQQRSSGLLLYTEEVSEDLSWWSGTGTWCWTYDKSAALKRNCFREDEDGGAKERAGGDSRRTQVQKIKNESDFGQPQRYLKRLTSKIGVREISLF